MFRKIKNYTITHTHKRVAAVFFGILAACVATFYILSYIASVHAATIFNIMMAKQKVLRGEITVQRLSANIHGKVTFENLHWKDDEGNNDIVIPEGSFRVRPWDVITKNINTHTVEELTLVNPVIVLSFDDHMHIQGFDTRKEADKKPPDPKNKGKKPPNLRMKDIDCKLILSNATIKAYYKTRIFLLNEVEANFRYKSNEQIVVNLVTGEFGGVLVGDGVSCRGTIDLKTPDQNCNLNFSTKALDPSSLGTGLNIKDKVTTIAHISGPLAGPLIEGKLQMEQLRIPGLVFSNLTGDYKYEDGVISADNVQAKVFGGTCDAKGNFNIDTKAYDVDVLGHDLQGGIAAHTLKLNCEVELDLKMRCNGDNKSTATYGSFTSGKGTYSMVQFDSISGKFHNQFNTLVFTVVEIDTPFGDVTSPRFTIVKGKLHLDDVYVGNKDTGQKRQLTVVKKHV